jgi:hypothetical protein
MVGDGGFDSAFNHRLLRVTHGIRSTIPPEYGRPPKDPAALPTDKYRELCDELSQRKVRIRLYACGSPTN